MTTVARKAAFVSFSSISMSNLHAVSVSVINSVNTMLNDVAAEEASVIVDNPQLFFEAVR